MERCVERRGRPCFHTDKFSREIVSNFALVFPDMYKYFTFVHICRHDCEVSEVEVQWWGLLKCYLDGKLPFVISAVMTRPCTCLQLLFFTVCVHALSTKHSTITLCAVKWIWGFFFKLKCKCQTKTANQRYNTTSNNLDIFIRPRWLTLWATVQVFLLCQPTWVASLLFRIPLE